MADLSITAANVVAGTGAKYEDGTAGETIAAGKAVYKDPTTKKFMLADSNAGTEVARKAIGVALAGASNGQPLRVQKSGILVLGATLTPGLAYYLSDTPGGICPVGDVGVGEYVCFMGVATSAANFWLNPLYTGVSN